MFNKTIFKQTLKANLKIWIIITAVLSLLNLALIAVFDPKTILTMADMVKDTPLANMLGNTTFLGMLSQTFYAIHAILLPLIYIIITGGNLIVSQVDRGSLAYLLSTPVKRSVVVRTQMLYFITSLFLMITISTIVGLFSIQVFHGGVWENEYTPDIKAASDVLKIEKSILKDDLNLILNNSSALEAGAMARGIDQDGYVAYLKLKMSDNAYNKVASIMNVEVDEIQENPAIIKDSDEALDAAAKIMGLDKADYMIYLDKLVAQQNALAPQAQEMQNNIFKGLTAAAEVIGIDKNDLVANIGQLKVDDEAFDAAIKASGIPKEQFTIIIDNQIASNEMALDNGIDFDIHQYLILNVGLFLLMFATSGISFMFSCIFNLSKNYMALGAGIPLAFFLFEMLAQVSDSLDIMKYFTLNTLFDKEAILNGGDYMIKFIILAGVGLVLYLVGIKVFKEKDLPL